MNSLTKELDILIGRKAHHIRYIHPARAWLLISPSLSSRQVNMASGQLLNEVFILLKVITPSPGYLKRWRIFEMTAVALGLKKVCQLVQTSYIKRIKLFLFLPYNKHLISRA